MSDEEDFKVQHIPMGSIDVPADFDWAEFFEQSRRELETEANLRGFVDAEAMIRHYNGDVEL